MKITVEDRDEGIVVRPEQSHINADRAIEFRRRLQGAVGQSGGWIVLDFREVEFIDSSGLGALVSVLKKAGLQGRVRFCGVRSGPRSILELTRLDRIFPVHRSVEEAVAGFQD